MEIKILYNKIYPSETFVSYGNKINYIRLKFIFITLLYKILFHRKQTFLYLLSKRSHGDMVYTQKSLKEIFESYINKKPIFKNKDALTTMFTPETIPHRDEQIKQLAHILAPVLRNEKPSNVFIYGKPGTGKTLVVKNVVNTLEETKPPHVKLKIIYINCKMKKVADTEYRLLAQIISFFNESVPFTGLPTNELYHKFFTLIEKNTENTILILDEIDALVNKIGSDILYNLTRINQELPNTKLTIIGISNDIFFIEQLDPRIKSSLSEEELIFPPYNAMQLRDILTERVKIAFDEGVVSQGAIAKCAALAAQEHGDARKALDLLRVAGEIAEREGEPIVTERHVDLAEQKLDIDRALEVIKTQPKQSKILMNTIIHLYRTQNEIQTGMVYDSYVEMCKNYGLKPLTQRRVSDLISEFQTFGILNTVVVSHGRYGRTRNITLSISETTIKKIEEFLAKEL